MRRQAVRKLLSIFVPAVLALLAAGDVGARLSFLPARPGGARPTPPRATPAVPPASSAVAACQAMIAGSSGRLLADVRDALGVCLARGVRCLVDETGSSACCEEAALVCQPDILRIAAATRLFRETVRAPGGACGKLPVEDLLAAQGLGFDVSACARLTPPVAVDDHARFADCLQLLLTKDVLHQVGLLDIPRAPEALVCMGLDDVLGDALGSDPATCEPTPPPSATPTATPEASPPDGTPTPTAPGPMPTPTPSPGTDGCQPRLFGPCQDAPFTGCCQTDRTCAQIIGEEGPGYCVTDPPSSTATPAASATPGPTATAGATATPSATSATPTPGPTHSAAVTPSPGATASPGPTPGPTASPGATGSPGPTASPGPTPVESCSTLTATVAVNYNPTEFPDVAGMTVSVTYPASVSIPGFGAEASVMQRVTNLTGVSGIFSMGDQDTAINVGLVSLSTVVPPGNFVRIVFDCASGAPVPAATSFSCTPDVSTSLGSLVTAACQISLATTP